MALIDAITSPQPRLPDIRAVHWLPRILMAAIIFQQGAMKVPLAMADADSVGVPFLLWALTAVGEICAAAALIVGGMFRNAFGDLVTRAGGFVLAFITLSVLVVIYWAPPMDLFIGNQLHLLLIIGGLYFAARGNAA